MISFDSKLETDGFGIFNYIIENHAVSDVVVLKRVNKYDIDSI